MPLCSQRLRQVQTPIIPVIAGWIRESPGTISLGQGVVSYGPPPEAAGCINRFLSDSNLNKYQPVQGIPPLVEAIQRKLQAENGIEAERSRIFVTAGGNLAFVNALLAIADPGDEIILQQPYYFNHEMAVTMASCKPVLAPTTVDYQLQPALIREAITNKTRAVVTVSPNNPTGAVYPEAALREVNQICRDHGIYHIHDEAYEYFTYDGAAHFSPGGIAESSSYTISLFSLSKAYGFASWRIGYMVAPAHLVEAINKIQDTLLICAPVISQFAALGTLQRGRDYCQEHLQDIQRAREIFLQNLALLGDAVEAPQTRGAFYFLVKIQGEIDSLELARRLIQEHKVAAIPGTAFGLSSGCFLRLAYAAFPSVAAEEGIRRFSRGLSAILHGGSNS